MRYLSVVISFLVMASLATATVFYLEQRVGQSRIQVQDHWLTSAEEPVAEASAYQSYGQ
jgi:hypothetical protein